MYENNFYRRNKVGMIGSTKGTEYEAYCRKIEDLFYENLDEIKLVSEDILDVTKSTWLINMQRFKDSITKLENMVSNLIDRIFKEVKNVEEGIEAIYALQRFKHRESLRDVLSTKWVQVRKNLYAYVYIYGGRKHSLHYVNKRIIIKLMQIVININMDIM